MKRVDLPVEENSVEKNKSNLTEKKHNDALRNETLRKLLWFGGYCGVLRSRLHGLTLTYFYLILKLYKLWLTQPSLDF